MAEKQISILLVAKNLASGTLGKVTKDVTTLGKVSNSAGRGVRALGVSLGVLGVAAAVGIGAAVKTGIAELAKTESAMAQTEAVVKSTGGAAKVTSAQINELAGSLQGITSIEDDTIQAGANMLLTFTNIRNGVGKGNDIFDQSLVALADMTTALGGDMPKAAIQLGKALNDPITGATALRRSGVQLTAVQMKWIKASGSLSEEENKRYVALRKTDKAAAARYRQGVLDNKLLAVQKVILAELTKEFGGSGAAQADTYAGKMRLIGFAVEDAQKALATGFLPVILKAGEWLRTKLADKQVLADIQSFGNSLAGVFDEALTFATQIPWGSVKDAVVGIGTAAKGALDLFKQMPDWAKTILIGGAIGNKITGGALGDIVGELGKGLIKGVLGINAGVVNVSGKVVTGGGPGGVVPTGGKTGAIGRVGTVLGNIGKVFLVGMAAGVAVELAGALGQQSTEIQEQGKGLVDTTKFNAGRMTEPELVAALKSINDTAKDPLSVAALLLTEPLNKGFSNLLATETILKDQLTVIRNNTAFLSDTRSESAAITRGLEGTRAAALESARAIRAKKWDVDVRVNVPVTVHATLSVRDHAVAVRKNAAYQGSGKVKGIGTG
jgi:hypothetical protein